MSEHTEYCAIHYGEACDCKPTEYLLKGAKLLGQFRTVTECMAPLQDRIRELELARKIDLRERQELLKQRDGLIADREMLRNELAAMKETK